MMPQPPDAFPFLGRPYKKRPPHNSTLHAKASLRRGRPGPGARLQPRRRVPHRRWQLQPGGRAATPACPTRKWWPCCLNCSLLHGAGIHGTRTRSPAVALHLPTAATYNSSEPAAAPLRLTLRCSDPACAAAAAGVGFLVVAVGEGGAVVGALAPASVGGGGANTTAASAECRVSAA